MQNDRSYSGNTLHRIAGNPIMIRLSFKMLSVGLIALACLLAVPALGAVIEPPVSVSDPPEPTLASPPAVPEIDQNSLGSVLALVLGSLGLLERRRLKAA